jgi:hypothetical protein
MHLSSKFLTVAAVSAAITTVSATLAAVSTDPATSVSLGAGARPSGLTAGDFDGDGDIDLATTVDNGNDVLVLLNDGAGNYSMGPNSNLPPSSSPQDVIAGDLDGDTILDLAVAMRDPSGAIAIMIGNGAGTFSMIGTVAVGDRPRSLSIADIDGDGDLDLTVSNRDSNTVSVLTNDGSASFSVQTVGIAGEPRGTAFGDFDGDGDSDLAVANRDDRSIEVFVNAAGRYTFSTSLSVGPFVRPDGVTTGDFDGNGSIDIAAAVNDATLNIDQAMVFLNTGAGFSGPFGYDTDGTNTSQIAAADLNCDGQLDLVLTNTDSGNASVLENSGGIFGPAMLIATGIAPGEIAIANIDGDADVDIAVCNRDSDDLSIIRNTSCPAVLPCPWDLDGGGDVGINDFLDLLAAWGANPGHPADFDGDNMVGIVDFLVLLNNWGPCP